MPLVGLIGKANVGKSTFFSAATMKLVEVAAYPFTTMKPNHGIAYVRRKCVCREFNVKDNPVNSLCINGDRYIPVEIIDCPGLVRGAHEGRGLGNQFLDAISRADALILVCDAAGATDTDGKPCDPGLSDPLEEAIMIIREYDLWFQNIVLRKWPRIKRRAESGEKIGQLIAETLSGLKISLEQVNIAIRESGLIEKPVSRWGKDDIIELLLKIREIAKPILIAANKCDLPEAEENVERLKTLGYPVIPCSADAELALRRAADKGFIQYYPGDSNFTVINESELTESQRRGLNLIRERVLERWGSTGVQAAINAAFLQLLNMITVYPVEDYEKLTDHEGRVLPDAYLIKRGTTAKELAYIIHSELGESFIFAVDARSKKRLGENYQLKDGDVISIVSAKKRG